jgi:hypothetical protein
MKTEVNLHYVILNAHRMLRRFYRGRTLWGLVCDLTSYGSTSSIKICREHGFDPHQDCWNQRLVTICDCCSEEKDILPTKNGCWVCQPCLDDLKARGVQLNPAWVKLGPEANIVFDNGALYGTVKM